ncbi:uncharacterized protein LOC62_02G003419 [Vanrija pseudolonga]|uniref:Uncharacterized protein n=1 Tax=Vanrija pseudolonga TaxID=143232 RepID=A0AAF1BJI6_9TREE|nr:hypothetical protein LOC62_02G003419 [Vanrija pseudolonga]
MLGLTTQAGGMAALFIIGTVMVILVRRRWRQSASKNRNQNNAMEVDSAPVEPFVSPAAEASVGDSGIPSISEARATTFAPAPPPNVHANDSTSWDAQPPPRVTLNHSHQSDHIRYHPPAAPPTEAEPPSYDPGWRGGLDSATGSDVEASVSAGVAARGGSGTSPTEATEKRAPQETSSRGGASTGKGTYPSEKQ